MSDDLNWSPKVQTSFSDEELIRHLRDTRQRPEQRTGNWFAFFSSLPKPEQQRLESEATK